MNTYDLREAASIAKVHYQTLRQMAASKRPDRPPGTKIGRAWVFPAHLFEKWLSGTLIAPEPRPKKRLQLPEIPFETLLEAAEKISTGMPAFDEPITAPARTTSYSAIRGRQRRKATPPWVDRRKIAKIYSKARELSRRTKVPHCVDHIVPLMSPVVCGLHVHYNMRVITIKANSSKGNRLLDLE